MNARHGQASGPAFVYAALWVPVLTAALAALLWALCTPVQLRALMNEQGPMEKTTEILYFVLALLSLLMGRAIGLDLRSSVALGWVFASFGMREMDLHKAWTGKSVLKVSFYLGEHPWQTKLVAAATLVAVLWAAAYLVRRHAKALLMAFRQRHAVAMTIVIFMVTMVLTKVLDRSVNLLVEEAHVYIGLSVRALVGSVEETMEMGLPLMAALAMWQQFRLRRADR